MAANLNFTNGKASIAYAGSTPWHGFGEKVTELQSGVEMLRHANALWTVSTRPLAHQVTEGGAFEKVTGYRAIVRDDTNVALGVCSGQYKPFQNEMGGELIDALMNEGARVEVAGVLGNGERVWALAKVNDAEFEPVKGDVIKPYVLLAWGHDGKHGIAGKATNIRVVCHNTLSAALGDKWKLSADVFFTHKGDIKVRLEEAREKLGIILVREAKVREAYAALAAVKMTAGDNARYFTSLFPEPALLAPSAPKADREAAEEKREKWLTHQDLLKMLVEQGKGASIPGVRGTAWGAYNAVTEWADHYYPMTKAGTVSMARTESVLFGSYADLKQRALDNALTLVG